MFHLWNELRTPNFSNLIFENQIFIQMEKIELINQLFLFFFLVNLKARL